MKKLLIAVAALAAIVAATACGNTKFTEEQEHKYRLDDSLQDALTNADSLFSLLYDVTTAMEQITSLEHLLNSEINPESVDARHNIERQMSAIQKGLIERRKRIAELEKQLGSNVAENAKLRTQISALREQIDKQAVTVSELIHRLQDANFRIVSLSDSVMGLTASVDSIAAVSASTQEELNQAVEDLNSVYFVIGSNEELKEHNFISGGGFLRKAKVLESDFDRNYMTRADRRHLSAIPLDAKRAEVKTNQPKDTYRLDKNDKDMLTLVITDPERFWAVSNILVIETKN